MISKKILLILGHTDIESCCGYLAMRYEEGAQAAGHEVRRVNIGDLQFDPILHKGYRVIQQLEPDLLKVQEDFKWAEHVVIIYPNWWSTMPAKLKGMFDRMFLPGFAFKINKTGWFPLWYRLLKGKSARVIITMENRPWVTRLLIGDYCNEISKGILWFSGISPVNILSIGQVESISPEKRAKWGDVVSKLGSRAV